MDYLHENRRTSRNRLLSSVAAAAVVAVCCALATPVGAAGPSDEVAKLLDKAAEKEYAGRHKKAMRLYRKADEAAGGRSREALVGLARIAYRIGDHERAREAADRLLELAEDRQTELFAHQLLGSSYYADEKLPDQERLERAANAYRHAARLAGDENWTPSYSLALTLEELGRSEEALEILRAAPYDSLSAKLLIPTRALLCKIRRARAGDPPWPGEESPGWAIYPVAKVDAPPRSLRAAIRNEGVEAEPEKMVEVPDADGRQEGAELFVEGHQPDRVLLPDEQPRQSCRQVARGFLIA